MISEAAGIPAGLASDGANRSEHAKALRADLGHRARRRVVERIHASINRYRSLLVR